MGIAVEVISAILKSVASSKIGNEFGNELAGIFIDEVTGKGIDEIKNFINEGKIKIEHILSKENMKSMNIPEDNIDYIVAEIKALFSRIDITDEVFRRCKYDSTKLSCFLWDEYCKSKNGYVENQSSIRQGLFAIAETLNKLICESENFEKDLMIQISNTVDDNNTAIQNIYNFLRINFDKINSNNQNVLDTLRINLKQNQRTIVQKSMKNSLTDKKTSLFISYSWNDREFVDGLDNKLQKHGYDIKRDIRDLEYAQSIKEFMKGIRRTDYSIIILSDDFLKSENCMREIFEFIKDENYKDRIIPIILESAKEILSEDKGMKYTIYWKEKKTNLEEKLKLIDEESKGGYIEALTIITSIKNSIGAVIGIFRDMKMFDMDENIDKKIIQYIKKKEKNRKKLVILNIFIVSIILVIIYIFMIPSNIRSKDNIVKEKYKEKNEKEDINKELVKLDDKINMSEISYKNEITKEANQGILYNYYDDFDSDGICEMFAIVGEKVYDDSIVGEIWFANQQGAYKVDDEKNYWKNPKAYLLEENIFIAFEEYYTTGAVTYLWGVKEGKPFQPNLTTKANGFAINKYNEIEITNSAYDGIREIPDDWKVLPDDERWIGHTYNKYYYYWDGANFREYGALEISVDDLLKIEGTKDLLNYIENLGATINEILYRDNKVIQINYQQEVHERNATVTYFHFISFRYEGKKIKLEDCVIGEGNVLKARNTSLAVYPVEFNIHSL